MTLLYSNHDRWRGSATGFSAGRAVRRLRTALKKIHRAIAAEKIRRVRNELRLHAATHANQARPHPHRLDAMANGDRSPRRPLHLGNKREF